MGFLKSFFKNLFGIKGEINDDFYDELETIMLSSDVGFDLTEEILNTLKQNIKKQKVKTISEAKEVLKNIMIDILNLQNEPLSFPTILTIIGVNGVGKTTAIGKLANKLKNDGKEIYLAAGDTFRAAASAQLTEWADRCKVRIIKHKEGADPAAVVFDAISAAKSKNVDALIIDTAGRLHNNSNLMQELKKIDRIVQREWEEANKQTYIVLDASIGQNSLVQVEQFSEVVKIDGIILTKLDGSSKGGIVFQIAKKYGFPIKYIGIGEGINDLKEFNTKEFVDNLL